MKPPTETPIICTVDVVLITLIDEALHVLLHRRERAPFQGVWALPGGYIHIEDDLDSHAAAVRVLRDKAGLESPYLEQLATFSGVSRDPRGWSLSVTYFAVVPPHMLHLQSDRQTLVPVDSAPGLPFDHTGILNAAVARLRGKSQYSSLPAHLCGESFTLPQLQRVYECVLGEPINKVSFRRKVNELDMIEAIEGAMETGSAHRPAQLYRLRKEFRRTLSLVHRGLNPRG